VTVSMWKRCAVGAAYILAAPLLLVWAAVKAVRYVRLLIRSVSGSAVCVGCHREVPLLGIWQCECGFRYEGHLLTPCSICHRVPKIARCFHCGLTTKLR